MTDPGPTNRTYLAERVIILCFDGLKNDFKTDIASNVRRLFQALERNKVDRQIIYYQPIAGAAYIPPEFPFSRAVQSATQALDNATAWFVGSHIMDAYQFIVDNHTSARDRICLFGFGRGAYIATCLSGMLHIVGKAHRGRNVREAYLLYKNSASSPEGKRAASTYKKEMAVDVKVNFLGVWETVIKYGIGTKTLPFRGHARSVRTFRQAKALDEPSSHYDMWSTPTGPARASSDPSMTQEDKGVSPPTPPDVPDIVIPWASSPVNDVTTSEIEQEPPTLDIPAKEAGPSRSPVSWKKPLDNKSLGDDPKGVFSGPTAKGEAADNTARGLLRHVASRQGSRSSSNEDSCDHCSPFIDCNHQITWFAGNREDISIAQSGGPSPANPSLLWMVQSVDDARLGVLWGPNAFEGIPTLSEYMKARQTSTPLNDADIQKHFENDLFRFLPVSGPTRWSFRFRPFKRSSPNDAVETGATKGRRRSFEEEGKMRVHSSVLYLLGERYTSKTNFTKAQIVDELGNPAPDSFTQNTSVPPGQSSGR